MMLYSVAAILLSFFPLDKPPVFSGPQPGERLPEFQIYGTAHSKSAQPFNVMERVGDKPVVLIFVHQRTRPAFGLANTVMRLVTDRKPEQIQGVLVYLSADPTEAADWMNRVQAYFPKGIITGVSTDGAEGPGAYGLNRDVTVTVVIGKNQKATASFALVQPGVEADAPRIFKAIADVLGEKQVPPVEKYSGSRRMQNRSDDQTNVRALLVPLIQKDATDEAVREAAEKIERAAASDDNLRLRVGDIARRIINAGKLNQYGTPKCQSYLKKWATEFTAGKKADGQKRSDNDSR